MLPFTSTVKDRPLHTPDSGDKHRNQEQDAHVVIETVTKFYIAA